MQSFGFWTGVLSGSTPRRRQTRLRPTSYRIFFFFFFDLCVLRRCSCQSCVESLQGSRLLACCIDLRCLRVGFVLFPFLFFVFFFSGLFDFDWSCFAPSPGVVLKAANDLTRKEPCKSIVTKVFGCFFFLPPVSAPSKRRAPASAGSFLLCYLK